MIARLVILIAVFSAIVVPLNAAEKSIAILDFQPVENTSVENGKDIADSMRLFFYNLKNDTDERVYNVENYQRMIKAQIAATDAGLDLRKLEDIVRLGKAYPVEYVMIGSVDYDGDSKYLVSLDIISVRDADITGSYYSVGSDLRETTADLVSKLSGSEDSGFEVLFPYEDALSDNEYEETRGIIETISSEEELSIYDILSARGKSLFLKKFWQRRDPVSETSENEFYVAFMDRISYTDSHFTTTFLKGYKSDRGKVYLKYGPPDEIEDTGIISESVRSFDESEWSSEGYVAWKYYGKSESAGKAAIFVFNDYAGDGGYKIHSSTEPGYGKFIKKFSEFDLNRLEADAYDTDTDSIYWDDERTTIK